MKKHPGKIFSFSLFLILGIAIFLRFKGLGETAAGTVLAVTYTLMAVVFLLYPSENKEKKEKPMATPKNYNRSKK
jgi:hypothetical protein